MTARYQLLNPWPEKALAFTTAVEHVADLIGRARSGMAAHFDLTVPGWRMLRLVEQSRGGATLSRLATLLQLARPSARDTANRLYDFGYLSIGPSPSDQRHRLLTVTIAGIECLSEVEAGIQALLLEMTNDVPAAFLEDAARVLDRMASRLSACETLLRRPPRRHATG